MSDERSYKLGEEDFCGGEEVSDDEEMSGEEEEMEVSGEKESLGEDAELNAEIKEEDGEDGSHSVGNYEEKSSVSSLNIHIKEMPVDRLSALSNSLLIHILSFLDTKTASITGVLSTRWYLLWMLVPRLKFCESSGEIEKISKFVSWVNRILVIYNASSLVSFEVEFTYYECFASDVHAWVVYAFKADVPKFNLLLNSSPNKDLYRLPQIMFENSFVEELSLRRCIMAPRRTIEWRSLGRLYLEYVELPQHVIEKLLTGCPILSILNLESCWGFHRLEANFQKLFALVIADCEDGNNVPLLEISSPFTHVLIIFPYLRGRKWRLTNIPSVVRVEFNFIVGCDWDANSTVEEMSNLKDLFEDLQHVNELELGWDCIKVISMLAMNGGELPQSKRRSLIVNTLCTDHSISGIICLLESSPNLETLVINCIESPKALANLGPAAKDDLDCDLLRLKTVHMTILSDPNLDGKLMMRLVQILLMRCTVLEKMVIIVDTGDFVSVIQTLLGYPRSSPNAVIVLP